MDALSAVIGIARWHITWFVRTRFFWIWTALTVGFLLVLNRITYFDFEATDGGLLRELFTSTVVFSTAVLSLAFHVAGPLRSRRSGEWGLVQSTPASAALLPWAYGLAVTGMLIGCALAFCLAFAASQLGLGRPLPSSLGPATIGLVAKVVSICAAHSAVSTVVSGFWALAGLLTVYLVGQLSVEVYAAAPRFLADLVFVVVPDLARLDPSTDAVGSALALVHGFAYAAVVLGLASAAVRRISRLRPLAVN